MPGQTKPGENSSVGWGQEDRGDNSRKEGGFPITTKGVGETVPPPEEKGRVDFQSKEGKIRLAKRSARRWGRTGRNGENQKKEKETTPTFMRRGGSQT